MVFLPHWPKFRGAMPIDLRLDRITVALERLDNPHDRLPPVVHFAGTNGKGSTQALLKAICIASGYKPHAYTSPHLLDFNERVVLAGKMIDDDALHALMEYCRLRLDDCEITYFEAITVAAFHAFAEKPADMVLLETGMGGRLDATNMVEDPAVTVITPIADDHAEYLGDTIYKIAGEKAGIMKPGRPCVVALQEEEAMRRLREVSEEKNAPLFAYEYDWGVTPGAEEGEYVFTTADARIPFRAPAHLPGRHQILNAATAVAAAYLLAKEGFSAITPETIAEGIAQARWPGRLQTLERGVVPSSLPQGWKVMLDGAHNPHGAQALADYIDGLPADMPVYLAAGQTRGRDRKAFLAPFAGRVKYVFGTSVFTEPSAYHGDLIAEAAAALNIPSRAFDSFTDIIDVINEEQPAPGLLLCCGSLYLLSDILRLNKGEGIY